MAEYTNIDNQIVQIGNNVQFNQTAICGNRCIMHRNGSGLVKLKGITNHCKARFRISFGANIAPNSTAGAISLAIAVDGEPLGETIATVTPTAVSYNNIYTSTFIDIPKCCCATVSIRNISTQSINVQNANLIVERVS